MPGVKEALERQGWTQETLSLEYLWADGTRRSGNWLNRHMCWQHKPRWEDVLWLCAKLGLTPCQAAGRRCHGQPLTMQEWQQRKTLEVFEDKPRKKRTPKTGS